MEALTLGDGRLVRSLETRGCRDRSRCPDTGAELIGRRVYVVQPPKGRHHESLWEIADRHLGDGRRYQEIYALNHARTHPDGRPRRCHRP